MAQSPSKHKRTSIANIFPDVMVSDQMDRLSLDSSSKKSEVTRKLSVIRQLSVGKSTLAWPTWSTIGRSKGRPVTVFTIRIEPDVLDYTKFGPSTAEDVFKEAANHIYQLRSNVEIDDKMVDLTDDELVNQMAMMVFGSNMIERVGTNLAETIQLCEKIFRGEQLSDIPARSSEYKQRLEAHIRANTQSEQKIRERREVINHAMALMHMVEAVIRDNKPFSEDLIKESHAILCSGVSVPVEGNKTISSNVYAGKYRTGHVAAGKTNFVTPSKIGQAMARFINELNEYLLRAEENGQIDPFFIAAQACGEFVNIHPFLDGNGRTCRIILNTILLKYAGIVCPIGEHDSERKEYLDIAQRRSEEESGNGELAWYTLKQSLPLIRGLMDKIVTEKLRRK